MEHTSSRFENRFYKFANVMIDVIHRGIMVFRYPWKTKSDNRIDLSKFTLVFEDNFDGDKIDENIWSHNAQGDRKGGFWDKDQAFVKDGNLIIRTEYKKDGKYGPGYYCDRIDSRKRFEQRYGYFECRCILPAAQGLWSAFWISTKAVSKNGNPGTNGTEIDVFESPLWYRKLNGHDNSMITSNLHYGGYEAQTRYKNVTVSKAVNPYSEFNTYGLEWNENEYIFYINGVETGRSRFGGVSKVPEYMELSVEVDGVDAEPYYGWSGLITRNKNNELPADFIVDYVKVYQYNSILEKESRG